MNNYVVSFGIGSYYIETIKRLEKSLDQFAPDIPRALWRSYPPGSPLHTEVPYAFKPYILKCAVQYSEYSNILWVDSTLVATKPLDKIFEHIEKHGWLFYKNGFTCGEWCTDKALEKHNITRDEAMEIPDITGCMIGLNAKNTIAMNFLSKWIEAANDGVSFLGDWNNNNNQCSLDKRCKGHRHDQVIASIIAYKMGMQTWEGYPDGYLSYYGQYSDSTIMVNIR